jgi:hypothetical protein
MAISMTGPMPDEFGNFEALTELHISRNNLSPSGVIYQQPLVQRFTLHDNLVVRNLDEEGFCAVEPTFYFNRGHGKLFFLCCFFCCNLNEWCRLSGSGDRKTDARMCFSREN